MGQPIEEIIPIIAPTPVVPTVIPTIVEPVPTVTDAPASV